MENTEVIKIEKKLRIVVGLSGGVDSSVTASLLKQQGHEVIGIFMKNWEADDNDTYCSTRQDFLDAASVADRIGIEFEAVNFSQEYQQRVFDYFIRSYEAGLTPNPDILCNTEIKFSAFLDHAMSLHADAIATGHYAQRQDITHERYGQTVQLLKAEDGTKDQSYFLHGLNQAQLSKAIFPLGGMTKREVRALAKSLDLSNHAKKDSTGICFIGERPFRSFLEGYLNKTPGNICTPDGTRIGEHQGLSFYTIGQRQGLHIGGQKHSSGQPWFVAHKDLATNTLIVVQGHEHPLLYQDRITIQSPHWISGIPPIEGWVYSAKTRYRQPDMPCHIDAIDEQSAVIQFAKPQWAATPGQYLVMYESKVCLGGGVIAKATNFAG
ncbi:MAG: tRNA 2-thiouridine(34) synthase MnmA [Pseudomonadota bacterium]